MPSMVSDLQSEGATMADVGGGRRRSRQFSQVSEAASPVAMWNLNIPRKIKSFVWQACSSCLPTADNLRMKRVHCPVECQMCLVKDESTMHLFTECNFSNAVWRMSGLPLITSGFNSFAQWVDLHILKLDVYKCGLLLMLCWKIWTARNDKIWNGKMASPSSLVEGTKCYLADWINIVNMGERLFLND